jgi:uncharacterized protein YndB with AHSA1/START domain
VSDTLTIQNGRQVLRIERRFRHAPEKVWRAVTEPERLSDWYPATVAELEPRVGGTLALDYGNDWKTTAVITEFEPPRRFAFTERAPEGMTRESDSLIAIELRPDGAGCLMIFSQTFDDRPAAASYAAGWQGCLDALEGNLDGTPPRRGNVSIERHQGYVRAFGLDQGTVERTPDGPRVCFERQLMRQPVDKVWAALTRSGAPAIGDQPPAAFVAEGITAGAITACDAGTMLEYDWLMDGRAGGRVRWELSSGPGGARIDLTQTGVEDQTAALTAWRTHIEGFVAHLIDAPA